MLNVLTRKQLLGITVVSGLAAGLVVLGIGGRVVMRILTVTLEEPPQFTIIGSLEVVGAGAAWGALTGPVLLVLSAVRSRHGRAVGAVFGLLVLLLATVTVALVAGLEDGIVAPTAFVVVAALLFVLLFLIHGYTVDFLVTRLQKRRT